MSGTFPSSDFSTEVEPWASVVIPAYNEEKRIGPTLARWLEFAETCGHDITILVVSDGSMDSTSEIVQRAAAEHRCIRLLKLTSHQGKGAALRAGIAASTGHFVCYTDADLPSDPTFLPIFANLLDDRHAEVAIAVRTEARPPVAVPFARILASAVYRWLVNQLVLPEVSDSQCGFKVFKRRDVVPLIGTLGIDGFAFDIELLRAVLDARLRVVEVPIQIVHRPGSSVHLWRDSIVMARDLLRIAAASRIRRLRAWGLKWADVG